MPTKKAPPGLTHPDLDYIDNDEIMRKMVNNLISSSSRRSSSRRSSSRRSSSRNVDNDENMRKMVSDLISSPRRSSPRRSSKISVNKIAKQMKKIFRDRKLLAKQKISEIKNIAKTLDDTDHEIKNIKNKILKATVMSTINVSINQLLGYDGRSLRRRRRS